MNQEEDLYKFFLKKINEIIVTNTANDTNHTFNPKVFFNSICPPYYLAFFIKTASYSPKKLYAFLMDQLYESFVLLLNNLNYSQFCYTIALMKVLHNSLIAYTGKEDILADKQFAILISIASELNINKITDSSNLFAINDAFFPMVQICSMKSSKQIPYFISEISRRLNGQPLTPELSWLINLTMWSIVSFDAFDLFLSSIPLFHISREYMKDFFINVVNSYKNVLMLMPNSYVPFLMLHSKLKYSESLLDLIDLMPNDQTIRIRTLLLLMQKSEMDSESLENSGIYLSLSRISYLSGSDPTFIEIMIALYSIISTYLAIEDKSFMNNFMKSIVKILSAFYQMNFKALADLDKGKDSSKIEMFIINIIITQIPLCFLVFSPSKFTDEIDPILKTSDFYQKSIIDISSCLAIYTKSQSKDFIDIYPALFEPLNTVIAANQDKTFKNIQQLMNTLKDSPYFLRSFIFNNHNTFIRLLDANVIDLILFKSISSTTTINEQLEPTFWTVTKEITNYIIKTLEIAAKQPSFIGTFKVSFLLDFFRFIKLAVKRKENMNQDDIQTIVINFEAIAYFILASYHHFTSIDPFIFFKNLIAMVKGSGLSIQSDIELIESFIKTNERNASIPVDFSVVYKRAQSQSEGMKKAAKILVIRLNSLTGRDSNDSSESTMPLDRQMSLSDVNTSETRFNDSQSFKLSAKSPADLLKDIENCLYILLPMLKEPTPKYNDSLSFLLNHTATSGSVIRTVIGKALSPQLFFSTFLAINSILKSMAKGNVELIQNGFCENSLVLMTLLLNNEHWISNPNYSAIFSSILDSIVHLYYKSKMNYQKEFCNFVISLFHFINRAEFSIVIDPNLRNTAAKLIFSWINQTSGQKDSSLLKMNFDALYLLFDGLDFLEIKSHEGKSSNRNSEALETFLFYYSQIRSIVMFGLDENNVNATQKLLAEDSLKLLSALLKNNLNIFINHTISLAIDGKIKIRTGFLNALTYVLTPEVYEQFVSPVIKHNLVDLMFISNFEIMRFLANATPYNKAADVASAIVEASALKQIEMEVFEDLVKIEMSNNKDPSRNTLFRGNAVPSRAVSFFPKYFADDWANTLIQPLLSLNASDLKQFWPSLISRIEEMFQSMPDRLTNAIQILFKLLAPESTQIAFSMLSGFIFLRFLCPMLAKVEGLVEVSSLLMSVSIKPTISENRPQFFCMKEEAEDSFNRIQNLFYKIVGFNPSQQKEGLNYTLPSIEIKPLDPIPDSEKVTNNLCSALWTQMPLFQQKLRETAEDLPIHQTLDKLIAKLEEMGKPSTSILTTVNMQHPISENLKSSLAELLKMPHDAQLEKWFYLTQAVAKDNSLVFMMKMSEITKPYTAQQLCSYIFTQLLLIGESQYTVVVDFSYFDILHLPPASQLKKVFKFADDEMSSRLSNVYVLRIQDSAVSYLNKASKLLKKLPKPLQMITDISMLHEKLGNIELSEATAEYFSTPESTFVLQSKSKYPMVRLHQNSIQIIDKFEINQTDFFSSKVILLSTIDSIRQTETSKTVSSFLIRLKDGQSIPIPSPNSLHIDKAVSKLLVRFNFGKDMKKNDLFVNRSSFRSLLLVLSFVNMTTSIGDQELKVAAYNLYAKTIESSGLNTNIEKKVYTANDIPSSLLETVEAISNDLAKLNVNEVHNFFFEFIKLIPYLNSKDYSNAERYIEPWIHYASEEIITNTVTLDNLAKIVTKTPKKCFMEFNRNIWRNFNQMNLLDSLFDKLCFYEDGCFASIFLSMSVQYPKEVTSFFIEKLEQFSTDQYQRQFEKLTVIIVNLIISDLFDESYKSKLLHFLSLIRLTPNPNVIRLSFTIFKSLFLNDSYDSDIFNYIKICDDDNLNKNEYDQFLINTAKIALLYRNQYSESLFELFNSDLKINQKCEDQNQLTFYLNSLIFISALKNDYRISFDVYRKSQSYKAIAAASIGLGITVKSMPSALLPRLFFTSLISSLYIRQSTPFYLIYSIIKTMNVKNVEKDLLSKVPQRSLDAFDKFLGFSFSRKPLSSFLIFLVPLYIRDLIDLQPLMNHFDTIPTNNKDDCYIYHLIRYHFDEKNVEILKFIDEKDRFIEESADIAAVSLLLSFVRPKPHMRTFLSLLLEKHPEYFSLINFSSFFVENSHKFAFIGSKLLILLSKATHLFHNDEGNASNEKYKLNPILSSYFNDHNAFQMELNNISSLFNAFLSM